MYWMNYYQLQEHYQRIQMITCITHTSKLPAKSFLFALIRRQKLVQFYSTSAEIQKYAWHLFLEMSCMGVV